MSFTISGVSNSTVSNSVCSEESQPKTLIENMSSAIEKFKKQHKDTSWITSNCQHIKIGNAHYYGIHKDQQMQSEETSQSPILATRQLYQIMKAHVLPNCKAIQIVGDSAAFSAEGTDRAKEFLREKLTGNHIVLYGYTGHAESDGRRCVNASVTDVIREKGIQDHVVANLVAFHTPMALQNWGCSGPNELQHYVIVYGDDDTCREHGTVFGDDITTSDFFADSLLMLEGGAQSFRQACNALLLDQIITVLSGLRAPPQAFANDGTPYFAAAEFLQEIDSLISQKDGNISEADLQEWYKGYFGPGKHYIADPKRRDSDTKQNLMDAAWSLFMSEKLYLKIQTKVSHQDRAL